jgi:hypothetical protein
MFNQQFSSSNEEYLVVTKDRPAAPILVGLFLQEETEETEKASQAVFLLQFTPFPPVDNPEKHS